MRKNLVKLLRRHTTSHQLVAKGRGIPFFQENPGWWNIILAPDKIYIHVYIYLYTSTFISGCQMVAKKGCRFSPSLRVWCQHPFKGAGIPNRIDVSDFVTPSTLKGLLFRWRSWVSGTAVSHDTVDGSCVQKTTCYLWNPYAKNGIFSRSIWISGFLNHQHAVAHMKSSCVGHGLTCWPNLWVEWFLRTPNLRKMTSTFFPRYCGLLGVLCWGSGRRRSPHDGGWEQFAVFEGVEMVVKRLLCFFSGCCFLLILEMMRTGDGKYSVWCFCLMFNLADSYCFVT